MTASELLALLGRAWFQLLIYPGGVAALALILLAGALGRRIERPPFPPLSNPAAAITVVAAPWLALALLPLPGAARLGRPLDVVGLLALLELPLLLAVAAGLRAADEGWRRDGLRRLAGALNGYPTLLLALLLLGASSGTLQPDRLASAPADLPAAALHWLGAFALLAALPPLLALGPFAPQGGGHTADQGPLAARLAGLADRPLKTGMRLRALGLAALASLPWCAALGGAAAWAAPLALPPLALLLWACSRMRPGGTGWARAYLALDAALLVALLAGSFKF
ncbi:MAG TPA: hypothetical protein VFS21_23375 [Roseiflexaceae bacterium]|nr:hypothetical protein [Roseiflexaceae bacterium]